MFGNDNDKDESTKRKNHELAPFKTSMFVLNKVVNYALGVPVCGRPTG